MFGRPFRSAKGQKFNSSFSEKFPTTMMRVRPNRAPRRLQKSADPARPDWHSTHHSTGLPVGQCFAFTPICVQYKAKLTQYICIIAQTDTVHIIALDCALFLDIHFTFTHTAPICVQCNVRLRHYTPIYTTNLHQYTPINNNIHQYVSIAMCVSYTMQCNAMCVYVRQYAIQCVCMSDNLQCNT